MTLRFLKTTYVTVREQAKLLNRDPKHVRRLRRRESVSLSGDSPGEQAVPRCGQCCLTGWLAVASVCHSAVPRA